MQKFIRLFIRWGWLPLMIIFLIMFIIENFF